MFYNTVALEYSTTDVRVPEYYRDKVDLANPKIGHIFKRDYLSYERTSRWELNLSYFPHQLIVGLLKNSSCTIRSAEYFHYMRNRNYIKYF